MDPAVETALSATAAGREVVSVEALAASGHPGNRTVRAAFGDGDAAYLKLATDGDGERIAREAAACRFVRANAGARAPEVLDCDAAADPPYLVTAPLGGAPADGQWVGGDDGERRRIARRLGRCLAAVAEPRFEDPGRVVGWADGDLALETGAWSEVLVGAVRDHADTVFADRFAGLPDRVCALLRERSPALDGAPAALVHQDPHLDNFFADPDPGLVDWDSALVGDPALAICWAEERVVGRADVDDPAPLRDALLDGYRSVAGRLPDGYERRRPLYRAVTFLEKPQTFDRWAPGAPEPADELEAWIRGELDRRVERARDR